MPNRTMASLSSPKPKAQPILLAAPAVEEKNDWITNTIYFIIHFTDYDILLLICIQGWNKNDSNQSKLIYIKPKPGRS